MRPAFKLVVESEADALIQAITWRLETDPDEVVGEFSSRHGVLRIPEPQRRFWTPYLELTIEDDASTKDPAARSTRSSRLWGTFSPRPEIWTAFVFAIGTLVIVSIFSSVYGVAQLVLGRAPFALLVPVTCVVLAGLLYMAALVGQGLSVADMYRLRSFLDDCLRDAEETPVRGPRSARESAQL